MSELANRRLEEKERRRAEILDAAESVVALTGWESVTMDQLARKARLSRALLYVYFKDKTDLMFGVAERALTLLGEHFAAAAAREALGVDQVRAMGRAYVDFSRSHPFYFATLARCELRSPDGIAEGHEAACLQQGDAVQNILNAALETGMRDGSVRRDVGPPAVIAMVLWGFMHGVIQLAASKANVLAHRGVSTDPLMDLALVMATQAVASGKPGRTTVKTSSRKSAGRKRQ